MIEKPWDNQHRKRYYGLRIGDTVDCGDSRLQQFSGEAKVVAYGGTDNNSVFIHIPGREKPLRCVAEWLNLIKKVEDK